MARWREGGAGSAALLLPGTVGVAGAGVLAAAAPELGAGVAGLTLLSCLGWQELFFLLALASTANRFRLHVGGLTVQPAHLILIPFALRVVLLTRSDARLRWRWQEWTIIAFLILQFATSYFNAASKVSSFLAAGLLTLGAVSYFSSFSSLCTRERLIFAARALLIASMIGSGIAVVAIGFHDTLHTSFLMSRGYKIGTPANGLAYEHDILGSFSAAAALVFLVLSRERNPIFSRQVCLIGFWLSFIPMLGALSRGAWLSFIAAFLFMWVVRRRFVRRPKRMGTVILIVFGAAAIGVAGFALTATNSDLATNAIAQQGSNLVNTQSSTAVARLSEWKIALDQFKRSPIFGLGTNSYGQRNIPPRVSSHNAAESPTGSKQAYLGNLYVRTLYDSGLTGLVLLAVFLMGVLWPSRVLRTSRGDLAPVAWAFVSGYLVLAIAFNFTDASFQVWPWLVLAVARVATVQATKQFAEGRSKRRVTDTRYDLPARSPLGVDA
jgi:hypothetical protein